jgi:hypothetical protein
MDVAQAVAARLALNGERCRRGYRLARAQGDFATEVRETLRRFLEPGPSRADEIWAVLEGVAGPTEATRAPMAALKSWLESDVPLDRLRESWPPGAPDLHSVLTSHPYAAVDAWSHRIRFRESSGMPRGS